MREGDFQQFARTATQLPKEQKRLLQTLLSECGNSSAQCGTINTSSPWAIFGSHTKSGIRRFY